MQCSVAVTNESVRSPIQRASREFNTSTSARYKGVSLGNVRLDTLGCERFPGDEGIVSTNEFLGEFNSPFEISGYPRIAH
jgi:hypothetical protein